MASLQEVDVLAQAFASTSLASGDDSEEKKEPLELRLRTALADVTQEIINLQKQLLNPAALQEAKLAKSIEELNAKISNSKATKAEESRLQRFTEKLDELILNPPTLTAAQEAKINAQITAAQEQQAKLEAQLAAQLQRQQSLPDADQSIANSAALSNESELDKFWKEQTKRPLPDVELDVAVGQRAFCSGAVDERDLSMFSAAACEAQRIIRGRFEAAYQKSTQKAWETPVNARWDRVEAKWKMLLRRVYPAEHASMVTPATARATAPAAAAVEQPPRDVCDGVNEWWLEQHLGRLQKIPIPTVSSTTGESSFDIPYLVPLMDLHALLTQKWELLYREQQLKTTISERKPPGNNRWSRKSDLHNKRETMIVESATSTAKHGWEDSIKVLNALICSHNVQLKKHNQSVFDGVGIQIIPDNDHKDRLRMVVTCLRNDKNEHCVLSTLDSVLLPDSSSTPKDILDFLAVCFKTVHYVVDQQQFLDTLDSHATVASKAEVKSGQENNESSNTESKNATTATKTTAKGPTPKPFTTPNKSPGTEQSSTPAPESSAMSGLGPTHLIATTASGLLTGGGHSSVPILQAHDLDDIRSSYCTAPLRLVAEGERSTVYVTELRPGVVSPHGRRVALKLSKPEQEDLMFVEEKALSALSSTSGVVRLLGLVETTAGSLGLVLEWLDEVDYSSLCTSASFHTFVSHLVETLCEMHLRGIAHADLKPSAVRRDCQGRPCLIDFNNAVTAIQLTGGALRGTPGYLFHDSPCKYGFSYDCVSLGVYLFELLCPDEDVGEYYLHSSAVSAAREAAGGSDWRAVHMKLVAQLLEQPGVPLQRTFTQWESEVFHPFASAQLDRQKVKRDSPCVAPRVGAHDKLDQRNNSLDICII